MSNNGDGVSTGGGSFSMIDLKKSNMVLNWIKKPKLTRSMQRGLSVEADSDKRRVVYVNVSDPLVLAKQKKNKFCSNEIRFLYEQFCKMSNLFFLLTALIQQLPDVSPSGRYTTLVPLGFILFVSLIKELIEDVKRRASDHRTNNKKTQVLRRDKNEWVTTRWKHIKVGDIVRVESNQSFPADLLFLSSSEPNSICFIETSNLDGETNLKIRPSLTITQDLKNLNELKSLSCEIEYEFPNQHLYQFVGNFKTHDNKIFPVGPDQILLRGSQLRNTGWINGLVLYTGRETKLMKNSRQPPMKRSKVEMMLNRQILLLFGILIALSLFSTILSAIWESRNGHIHWYLGPQQSDQSSFIFTFLTFMLLYQNLIPISLPVTLEVVKFIQAFFINWDEEMYDEENDFYAVARTSNLNEELGLVKYVFSDKTGTLTRNQMELKKCSIAGVVYDRDSQESNYQVLVNDMDTDDQFRANAVEFLNVLSVCHSANPEIIDGVLQYQASSPDESAFLDATKEIGVKFHTRLQDQIQINFLGHEKTFKILNVLEFNSVRKRMSVIVREPSTNKIKLFCKGADEAILPRLDPQQAQFKTVTWQHLEFFAREGLRTLVLAYKEISETDYHTWNQKFDEAATSLSNRSENLQNVAELIETNLIVLGSTAIEDKLQIGVPETISKLRTAGIKVWVLTGDKTETAINIGYSCKLLSPETNLIFLNGTNPEVTQVLKEWGEFIDTQKGLLSGNALVIEGQSLKYALQADNTDNFYKVASTVDVVIYSRATPKSKAQVVDFIKTRTPDVTLAIGDGANDVSMIQTAHLGIGIQGKEGTNALAASDYAIGQFRFLARLLFVHGTLNYSRVNKVIFYSIYKNICLYMMNFWSGFQNGFSGQLFVDRWLISLYNMIFTSWPPMGLGLYERPLNDTTLLNYPQLYLEVYEKSLRSARKFWMYVGNSLIHSGMIFGFTIGILEHDIFALNGTIGDHIFMGNYAFNFCVIIVCLKASLETDSWTFFTHLFNWGSILVWIVFLIVYSHTWPWLDVGADMVGMDDNLLLSGLFWMSTVFVCIAVLIPDLVFKTIKRMYFKSLFQSVQEEEIKKSKSNEVTVDDVEEGRRKQSRIMSILSRESLARKTTILLKRIRGPKVGSPPANTVYRGYAFSQEENGKISQSKLIMKQP